MSSPTVAFFGATGGVANSILIHTLLAGYKATALIRTPKKLLDQLTAQEVPADLIKNLTIIEGNAVDVAAVKRTLLASGPNTLPSVIVSGLGALPIFRFKWRNPLDFAAMDQPTICETAAATQLTALREIYAENPSWKNQHDKKPLMIFISTTGITRGPEDVPFWLRFLYHHMLAVAHADKRKMENLYRADTEQSDEAQRVFRNVTGMRPTLLTPYANVGWDYRDRVGVEKIRAGKENEPALGYSIKRGDVGLWTWENVVSRALTGKGEWEGEMVSLTS